MSDKKPGDRKAVESSARNITVYRWRYALVVLLLAVLPGLLIWHIASLQVLPNKDRGFEFLQSQSLARTVRSESIPAYRGVITDRNGEPLAVSSPVVTIWANPQVLIPPPAPAVDATFSRLAEVLGMPEPQLIDKLQRFASKEFMYLARHLAPEQAEQIMNLEVPGVYSQLEYKRFYPAGEVTAQLVGFTNIDDQGQDGLELAYDEVLRGVPGKKRVLKDLKGRIIKDLELVRAEKPGESLALSIDLRLQYTAFTALKAAVEENDAVAATMVVLDVKSGEVMAMVNQPSYNPNDRRQLTSDALRNRAVTDLVEPGSLMKPLTVAAALETGKFGMDTIFDTNPGYVVWGRKAFYDIHNYGVLDIAGILKKSSQVGTVKLAMELDPDHVRDLFFRFGLGQSPGTGFPGESPGSLPQHTKWRATERANFAFGHGLSGTALQLATAYSVLADDGNRKPPSLLRVDGEPPFSERAISPEIARTLRDVLINVTLPGGTATRAQVPGYDVAGKTGTVHKVGANGYEKRRYMSLFAGMIPADNPRFVAVVIVDDPKAKGHYGGLVAAPVFSKVASQAVRLFNVPPSNFGEEESVAVTQSRRESDAGGDT
ncbi:MAG: peptidoglycan D,D-transpeptidase FtsI family protein [bacterium]